MPADKIQELCVDERRGKIIELLAKDGKVKVNELSKLFCISEVTVRNDLSELENEGLLERVHGGAVSRHKFYYRLSLHERMKTNEDEKRRIAAAAAARVNDGDTLLINSGTTTLFAVQELRNLKNLTIVTNSITISEEIGRYNNINLILLGGILSPDYMFTYGDDTINQLKKYKADKLILAADGISVQDGITTYHHLEAETNRQMIARANTTIAVADYSKIARTSFSFIDSIDAIDVLITDWKANKTELKEIAARGVELVEA